VLRPDAVERRAAATRSAPARSAATITSSATSKGFARCAWYPARSALAVSGARERGQRDGRDLVALRLAGAQGRMSW
jgi:hypothetical protein